VLIIKKILRRYFLLLKHKIRYEVRFPCTLYIHPRKHRARARGSALIAVAKFQPNYHFGQPPSGSEFLSADAQQKTEVTSTMESRPAHSKRILTATS